MITFKTIFTAWKNHNFMNKNHDFMNENHEIVNTFHEFVNIYFLYPCCNLLVFPITYDPAHYPITTKTYELTTRGNTSSLHPPSPPHHLIQPPVGTDSWLAGTIDYITTHFWRAAAARLQTTPGAKGPLATAKLAMIPACRTVLLQLKWIAPRPPPLLSKDRKFMATICTAGYFCAFILLRSDGGTPGGQIWHLR